eukprot:jgi/Chlat1/5470/Chrsp36S05452
MTIAGPEASHSTVTGLRFPNANALANKLYEERLKQTQAAAAGRGADGGLDENALKLLDNQAALLKAAAGGQGIGGFDTNNINASMARQLLASPSLSNGGNLQREGSGMLPPSMQAKLQVDGKGDVPGSLQRPGSGEGSMYAGMGPGQATHNAAPAGPMRTPQFQTQAQFQQFQMLNQQQQQQLLLHAQQTAQQQLAGNPSGSLSELEASRLREIMNRKSVRGKDSPGVSGLGVSESPLGSGLVTGLGPVKGAPRTPQEQELLLKSIQQQPTPSSQSQGDSQGTAPYGVGDGLAASPVDAPAGRGRGRPTRSNSAKTNQSRKRKPQQSAGDMSVLRQALHGGKPPALGISESHPSSPSYTSQPTSQQVHLPHDGVDRFHSTIDAALDDNVDDYLRTEADPHDSIFDDASITAPSLSSHLDLPKDGKILASAGHDKKLLPKVICVNDSTRQPSVIERVVAQAILWNVDTLQPAQSLEEHSALITDVRFGQISHRLATSSWDKSVRVWDCDTPNFSGTTFTGHSTSVQSCDFHPSNDDMLCSCDSDGEIRFWSINQGICTSVFKGATKQTRFQSVHGRMLAAASDNVVAVFDVENEVLLHSLQGHTKPVQSLCWDAEGNFVASVSEDSVRVWALANNDGEMVHELISSGNKFHSCVFHPTFPSLLIVGCYQSLELWNMVENKSMSLPAHEGIIAALASSPATAMVASASHDSYVKLWK